MKTGPEKADLRGTFPPASIYEFGPFLLDFSTRRLFLRGQVVSLTSKLFDILLLLVEKRGEVVTKDDLMKVVWPDQFVEENNLTVSMSALRKALGERYGERRYIETVPKRGYRFLARVSVSQCGEAADGKYRAGAGWESRTARPEVATSAATSLAVLPLFNESHDPSLEYLSEGLAESIINSLSQIPQLRVLARSAAFRYKGKDLDVHRIGQELNVPAVLMGRVLQLKERLIISVELVDVENSTQLWGGKYNCLFSNLFTVQEEIATEVSEKLRLRLTSWEKNFLTKRYTENAEAYRLYLKGRFFWNKRSIQGIKKAIENFRQAIERDENYSLAYSGLTDCYATFSAYGVYPPKDVMPKAKETVLRALEIDDMLAEAHTSLANIKQLYDLDWPGAEREYRRAIELNPNYATAHHWYADYLTKMGRFDEALERIKHALEIDPLSLIINKTLGKILYFAREYDAAIEQCLETLEIEPNFGPVSGQLAYVYAAKGIYPEAIAEMEKLISSSAGEYEIPAGANMDSFSGQKKQVVFSQSDPEAIGALGHFYALAGRQDEALELVRGLKKLRKHRYIEPHTVAMIYIGLEDKDQALKWLEKSYVEHSSVVTHLKFWPFLDPLRSDSRFVDLCRRVGFD
jgi:TolB-like protein